MRYAIIFSGQGNQHPGMFPWLQPSELVQRACDLLRFSDWRNALSDTSVAQDNQTAQILLTALGLTAWRLVEGQLGEPEVTAGYSVGELSSFCLAGVYSPATAIELAHVRANAMNRSAALSPGGLVGVTGLSRNQLEMTLRDTSAFESIQLCPSSSIVGGADAHLRHFAEAAEAIGATCTHLWS